MAWLGSARTAVCRLIVVALIVPLACAALLPSFARMLSGPAAHVCKCEMRGGHSTCACPICNPDRDDLALSEESIRGRCGEDDVAFGGELGLAVLPAPFVLPASAMSLASLPAAGPRPPDVALPPPTPPPRQSPVSA